MSPILAAIGCAIEMADLTMGGVVMQSGVVVQNDVSSQIPFS